MESSYVHKRHNVSVLMYHVVCAAKYRRVVMSEKVDEMLKEVCLEIAAYVHNQGGQSDYRQLHKDQLEFGLS